MNTPQPSPAPIDRWVPRHAHFLGIDSDGCVFDVMDLKHRECFCPKFILHFACQACSNAAREVWEFVNLRSRTRGTNRFPALVRAIALLRDRADVAWQPPWPTARLEAWVAGPGPQSEAGLEAELARGDAPCLRAVLAWSREVNAEIRRMAVGVPPIPAAGECLAAAAARADLMVVSLTPQEAIRREWTHAGLARHVALIAGQEYGPKAEQLRLAAIGRYAPDRILVVGDAPGDQSAAEACGVRFYPIIPGDEAACWHHLHDEFLPRFLDGGFDDACQAGLVAAFRSRLPDTPPWPRRRGDAPC